MFHFRNIVVPKTFRNSLLVGLIAGVVAAVFTLFVPNYYRSEARILPADARGNAGIGQLAAAAAAVGVAIPGQESPDAAYVDILNSIWLRERVLTKTYRFDVKGWYFGSRESREQTLEAYLGKKNRDRALVALRERISVVRDLKTKLLTVSVETPSPDLSQQVAREMVRQLEEFVLQRTRTRGGMKAAFAEQRIKEAREAYAQIEDDLRGFLSVNRNYQVSADPSVRLKGARLEAEFKLRQQILTTLAISREQALLDEKNDMPILNILDSGNLPIEKSRPKRSVIVILTCILFGVAAWLVETGKATRFIRGLRLSIE